MNPRLATASVLAVLALVLLMSAGCVLRPTTSGTQSTSPVSVTPPPYSTAGSNGSGGSKSSLALPGGSSSAGKSSGSSGGSAKAADLTSIDKQLGAMQTEIDSMKMPSDSDFNGVQSAVY